MNAVEHDYFLSVARSLAACQVVELELKLYISQALEVVKKCVAGRVPFAIAGEDYKDSSLERLIDAFRKLSSNPDLVKRLGKFKDERNFVAHRAITACMDSEGDLAQIATALLQPRLEEIEKEATALVAAINQESLKFVAQLYFDAEKG